EPARGGAADSAGGSGDDDDVAHAYSIPALPRSQTSLPVQDLDAVTVAQLVLAPDLLPREPRRRPPDPGAGAPLAQLVVDRVGDVEHGGGRLQGDRTPARAQMDADEACHRPQLLAQPVEACVVEHRHGQDGQLGMLGRWRPGRLWWRRDGASRD